MHPRNDIKNLQAAPTSGTSSKEGLKSFNFFLFKFFYLFTILLRQITSPYTQSSKKNYQPPWISESSLKGGLKAFNFL